MAKEAQPKTLQLCVFDTERDYPEGEEARQILAYHPETCSVTDQTSVIGLAQALLTFCQTFEEANDTGQTKAQLQTVLNETAGRLLRAKSADLLTVASPLSMVGGVPWLPLHNHIFTAVHSLASHLTVADLGDGRMVQAVMVLHDHYCMWSSLPQQDTASLYRFAASTLVPASQGPSMGKRLASATSSLRSQHAEASHPIMSYKAWVRNQSGFLSLHQPAASPDADHLLAPKLHLQGEEESPALLGYCQGNTVLVLLLAQSSGMVSSRTQQGIARIAQGPLRRISQATAEQLTAQRHCHIPGFRYLYVDHMLAAVQASPHNKVATLSSGSLEVMASARHELRSMSSSQGDDREVIVRGTRDCWVVARHRNGRELYLVMEGKGEIGLAGAAELASSFAENHFPALF